MKHYCCNVKASDNTSRITRSTGSSLQHRQQKPLQVYFQQ